MITNLVTLAALTTGLELIIAEYLAYSYHETGLIIAKISVTLCSL